MEDNERRLRKFAALAGSVFLIPPCICWVFWIAAVSSSPNASQGERVKRFLSHFPAALQDPQLLTIIALVSCILAVMLSTVSMKESSGIFRFIGVLTIIVASFLGLLSFFTTL